MGIFNVSKYPGLTYANRETLCVFPITPVTRKKCDHIDPLNGMWVDEAAAATPGTDRISRVSRS
jgi:hypothetical protein